MPESTPFAIDARIEIIGTEEVINTNCREAGLAIHDAQGVRMPDTMYWPRPFGNYVGILQNELRYFANCVRQNKAPKRITVQESRAAVEWMEAATRSAQTGTVITF